MFNSAQCGGEIEANESPQHITSPGYESGHYENFQECNWHIKVTIRLQLLLVAEILNSKSCENWNLLFFLLFSAWSNTDIAFFRPRQVTGWSLSLRISLECTARTVKCATIGWKSDMKGTWPIQDQGNCQKQIRFFKNSFLSGSLVDWKIFEEEDETVHLLQRKEGCVLVFTSVSLFRLCCYSRPEDRIVSTGSEMMLLFRSSWNHEFYHSRVGFKAVISIGKKKVCQN